ncbi:response regulator [Planctomycetota bacterium]
MSIKWLQTNVKKKIMEKRAVLFVDDDEIVLKSIEKSIKDEPYDIYFAESGKDALEILKQEEVHVIIVDIAMPGMDGLELLKIVKKEYPKIVSMVISGFMQSTDIMMVLQQEGVYKFIPKNWTFDEDLKMVIRRAIDTYNLQREHEGTAAELELCPTKIKEGKAE